MTALMAAMLLAAPSVALWELRSEIRDETAGGFLQAEPSIAYTPGLDDLTASLKYQPRFLLAEPGTDPKSLYLHRGSAEIGWRADPGTLLSLRQNFQYGRDDYSWMTQLADSPTPNFGAVPIQSPLLLMQSSTFAAVQERLSKRLELQATGGWQVSGGANADARATVPLAHSANGVVSAVWTPSTDRISVTASATHTRVLQNATNSSPATLLEGSYFAGHADWTHTMKSLELGGSIGIGRAFGSLQTQWLPTGSVSLRTLPAAAGQRRFGGELVASLVPSVDPFTGTLIERVIGTAALKTVLTRDLSVSAGGGAARDTNGTFSSITQWQGFFNVSNALGSKAAVFAGVRAVSEPSRQWAMVIGFNASRKDVF